MTTYDPNGPKPKCSHCGKGTLEIPETIDWAVDAAASRPSDDEIVTRLADRLTVFLCNACRQVLVLVDAGRFQLDEDGRKAAHGAGKFAN